MRRGASGIEAQDGGPHYAVAIAKSRMGTSRKLPEKGVGGVEAGWDVERQPRTTKSLE